MFSGFPLGGVLGGLLSVELIDSFGWEAVFVFGGVAPIVFSLVLVLTLPESIPYLVNKWNKGNETVGRIIAQYLSYIAPAEKISSTYEFLMPTEMSPTSGISVRQLFEEDRSKGTLMLWIIFYCNLLMYYFLGQWLPTILADAGLPVRLAIIAAILLNAGCVFGGIFLGFLVDKYGPYRVLCLNYLVAAISTALIGIMSQNLYQVSVMVFFAGFCVGGGQLVANGLSAIYYPAAMRATGVSWAVGWSRIGAICGPLAAGWLISRDFSTEWLFVLCAVPAIFASAAVFFMGNMNDNGKKLY